MPLLHRPIPPTPNAPRIRPIAPDIRRSYPTGRQEFSRAFSGSEMVLTIRASAPFPRKAQVMLVTTLNVKKEGKSEEVAFERTDEKTFECRITPERPGLFWFWAKFSTDGGKTWMHDPVPDAAVLVDPPQVDHLRLYTLIPNVSGTMADWSAALQGIKAMGFNAVHLLPLTTLDTSLSPYSARNLFAVDPSYVAPGTGKSGLAQLEEFIETARGLELRLCFDLVMNHVGTESVIARKAPEWIVPDVTKPDGLRRARYWCDRGWLEWEDLVLIDYEHPLHEIRQHIHAYMTEYALFWAKYASLTNGFVRFDNLHSSDKRFIDELSRRLHAEYPNVGIIAEYFTDVATLLDTIPKWGLNLILATPWDAKFVPKLRAYLKYIHSISGHVRFFMPVSSHDSGSPAQEFGDVQSTVPRYVAAALMGTGATGITQGVEWGIPERINFIGKQPRLAHEGVPRFGEFLRRVNEMLVAHPALRRGQNCEFVDQDHEAIIAVFRRNGRHGRTGYLIACNFDIFHEQTLTVDLAQFLGSQGPVDAVDLFTGQTEKFASSQVTLKLTPCSAQVWMF